MAANKTTGAILFYLHHFKQYGGILGKLTFSRSRKFFSGKRLSDSWSGPQITPEYMTLTFFWEKKILKKISCQYWPNFFEKKIIFKKMWVSCIRGLIGALITNLTIVFLKKIFLTLKTSIYPIFHHTAWKDVYKRV